MTIRELARLAGVSSATVSLALGNHPRISPATKKLVLRLARKHDYRVDGRLSELMGAIRTHKSDEIKGCLGLISLYEEERPWETPARIYLRNYYRAVLQRAKELGYRVEPFWVRQPGLSPQRLASIIEARGIKGLISLGSPELEDDMPAPLQKFTIVTFGASIRTRLHRVLSHFSQLTNLLMATLKERGYRRPGAVLQHYQDGRNLHQVSGIYLYYSKYVFDGLDIPIFYAKQAPEPVALDRWFRRYKPDVIIFGEQNRYYPPIAACLHQRGLNVPRDVGLALVASSYHPDNMSGVRQDFDLTGRSAVEMLVSNLQQGSYGLPAAPKVICLDGEWVDGNTLLHSRR